MAEVKSYRVLRGLHITSELNSNGKPRVAKKGDIVRTESNLLKFNAPGVPPRFELATGEVTEESKSNSSVSYSNTEYLDTLSAMSKEELKKVAETEEIDIRGLTRKEDIMDCIIKAISNR
jgi:hypothetical protein